MKILTERNWSELTSAFLSGRPFNHVVIDNFFTPKIASQLAEDFPAYESTIWNVYYNNAIENKKTCNHWDKFPNTTYNVFHYLCGSEFANIVSDITGNRSVQADIGLHGGGWHAHTRSGKLNIHLDYSMHPKLQLQRRYNLIVYVTPDWKSYWGGGLELWESDLSGQAIDLHTTIENKFNRAVLFDTTQNSWHGLPKELICPEGTTRQSLAVYYVAVPEHDIDPRTRARFIPYENQVDDPEILNLIKIRSS